MLKKIVASNFKTNHTRKSTKVFLDELNSFVKDSNIENEILLFPTSASLDSFELNSNIKVGVQNAYPTKNGSFTGEIGLEQIEEFGIKTILIGHSERRHILKESQELIVKKYNFYKEQGFNIVYCIGEPLEVKENGIEATLEYLFEQLEGIDLNYDNLILAYEPVWAIGTGVVAKSSDIEAIHSKLKQTIDKPILYGGSVKASNAKEILSINGVDGALIGTASWKVEDFKEIISIVKDL